MKKLLIAVLSFGIFVQSFPIFAFAAPDASVNSALLEEAATPEYQEPGLAAAPLQSAEPTEEPEITSEPTEEPGQTPEPTEEPGKEPEPTEEPGQTPEPTEEPGQMPEPTEEPGQMPEPTEEPGQTPEPTEEPEQMPEPAEEPEQASELQESNVKASPSPEKQVPLEEDLDYILGRPMTEEERAEQMAFMPESLPELPEDLPVEDEDEGISLFAAVPETYDSRDYGYITPVRNQNPYGACWTYASLASMESSLIMQEIVEDASEPDLSEWHLAYYATHTGGDALGNTKGDIITPPEGVTYMDNGGTASMAIVALSNWKGATPDSLYPVLRDKNELAEAENQLTPETAYENNSYYLRDCYIVAAKEKNIKTMVQEAGAVYAGFYWKADYYNPDTAAYYCDIKEKISDSHAIAIVGWDDNYRKENFKSKPEKDGAWLCKNSWGEEWGAQGYFYISYEDATLTDGNINTFRGEEADKTLNNYYYSGGVDDQSTVKTVLGKNGQGNDIVAAGIAQCYTAKGNEGGAEEIVSVGFNTLTPGIPYSIQIYKNPDATGGVVTEPESGEPMLTEAQQGVTSYAGYCTIDLEQPVVMAEGDVFSVVVNFGKGVNVRMDTTKERRTTGGALVYGSVNETAEGESFLKAEGESDYTDLHGKNATPRMNIITKDMKMTLSLQQEEGLVRVGSCSGLKEAAELIKSRNDKGDYVLTLFADILPEEGEEASFVMPASGSSNSLSVEGNGHTIFYTGDIKLNSDLIFKNIILQNQDSGQDISTLDADGYRLIFEDSVLFTKPAELIGSEGILEIRSDNVKAGGEEGFCGKIYDFEEVILEGSFTLLSYTAIDGTRAGGSLASIENLGVFGEEGAPLSLKAEEISVQTLTLSYGAAFAEGEFAILGDLISEGAGNKLITRQTEDAAGAVTGVFLNLDGEAVLSSPEEKIEIQVLTADKTKEEAAYLRGKFEGTGVLLHAKAASEDCFLPSDSNCKTGEKKRPVKKEDTIYLCDTSDKPVELFVIKENEKLLEGNYDTFAKAAAAAEAKKDRSASYLFLLHEGCEEGEAERFTMPAYAAKVTVKKAKDAETAVWKLASDLTLCSDTVLEDIQILPDFGDGTLSVRMGKYALTMKGVSFAEGGKLKDITCSAKAGKTLTLQGKEGSCSYEVNSLTVKQLLLGEGVTLETKGGISTESLSLGENACLTLGKGSSVITKIAEYTPFLTGGGLPEKASKIILKSNADLTISNSLTEDEAPLWLGKESPVIIDDLAGIKPENKLFTAGKAAASDFAFFRGEDDGSGNLLWKNAAEEGQIVFWHNKSFYLAGEDSDKNGLLQVKGSSSGKESYFADWEQAIAQINYLADKAGAYQLSLLSDIENTGRLNSSGGQIAGAGALKLPSDGKCASLLVTGKRGPGEKNYRLAFTGNLTVSNFCTFDGVDLEPVKVSNGKESKNGFLNGSITGSGKNAGLCLKNGTHLQVTGNITGLKKLSLEEGEEPVSLLVSSNVTVQELTINGKENAGEEISLQDTRLVVTGNLSANTLAGRYGLLSVRQKSAKDNTTKGTVKGSEKENCLLTVLVLRSGITDIRKYQEKLAEKESPFVEDAVGIPLLKAPVMAAECIRTLQAGAWQEDGPLFTEIKAAGSAKKAVCYKDSNQYIRMSYPEEMKIRVTVLDENGSVSTAGYAKSFAKAVQMVSGMGKSHDWYGIEIMETQALKGKLPLPSGIKGTVEISSSEGAKLSYVGPLTVPAGMTLTLNALSFSQVNEKGNETAKKIVVNSGGSLKLLKEGEYCQNVASLSAPKGSVILCDTQILVKGKTAIKNLYVSKEANGLAGRGDISLGAVLPANGADEGNIHIETVSKYKKNGKKYTMTQLSGLSLTGGADKGVKITLHILKDAEKAGTEEEYSFNEILLENEESTSPKKRLALISGNAADSVLTVVDKDGEDITKQMEGSCLFTENGGIYLLPEKPFVRASSLGETSQEYLGSFRTVEAALKAVKVSAQRDAARKNKRRYEILLTGEPKKPVSFALPSGVLEIAFRYEKEGGLPLAPYGNEGMEMGFKGNITLKSPAAFTNIKLVSKDSKGNQGAGYIKTGKYELTLASSSLYAGNITAGKLLLKESLLRAVSGKIKTTELYSLNESEENLNVLAARQDKYGKPCIEITGSAYKGTPQDKTETEKPQFAVLLYTGGISSQPAFLEQGRKLVLAKKAGSVLFTPAYTGEGLPDSMGSKKENFGTYKKGSYVCYGNTATAEAMLRAWEKGIEEASSGSSLFLTLQEALAETESRKSKKVQYEIVLLRDVEIRNSKGSLAALTLPVYAKELHLKGKVKSGGDLPSIRCLGALSLRSNTLFENIKLMPEQKVLDGKKWQLGVAGILQIDGKVQGETLLLKDGAGLQAKEIVTTNLTSEGDADIYIDRGCIITVTGFLKTASITGKMTLHPDYPSIPSGTRLIAIRSIKSREDLSGISVKDTSGNGGYALYRDGKNVCCRKISA